MIQWSRMDGFWAQWSSRAKENTRTWGHYRTDRKSQCCEWEGKRKGSVTSSSGGVAVDNSAQTWAKTVLYRKHCYGGFNLIECCDFQALTPFSLKVPTCTCFSSLPRGPHRNLWKANRHEDFPLPPNAEATYPDYHIWLLLHGRKWCLVGVWRTLPWAGIVLQGLFQSTCWSPSNYGSSF